MAVKACKRKVRRKLLCRTSNQVVKIGTYQLSRSVKVMITDKHPVLNHRLEGLLIHVDKEWDGILLCASRHRYSEIIGIEVAQMPNRRLGLVERASTVDDLPSTLWIDGSSSGDGSSSAAEHVCSAAPSHAAFSC